VAQAGGLGDLIERAELGHPGLDVQDRRAVHRVEAADVDVEAVHLQQPAAGDAEQIRAVLAALGEDADQRPVRVAPWMAGAGLDLLGRYAVEMEDHLDV
jgi:hypothetical protein